MTPPHELSEFHEFGTLSHPTEKEVLDAAWKFQKQRGCFSIRDLYYECYGLSRNTVWKTRTHRVSTYLLRIVQLAGAVKIDGKSGYSKYKFPEDNNDKN